MDADFRADSPKGVAGPLDGLRTGLPGPYVAAAKWAWLGEPRRVTGDRAKHRAKTTPKQGYRAPEPTRGGCRGFQTPHILNEIGPGTSPRSAGRGPVSGVGVTRRRIAATNHTMPSADRMAPATEQGPAHLPRSRAHAKRAEVLSRFCEPSRGRFAKPRNRLLPTLSNPLTP